MTHHPIGFIRPPRPAAPRRAPLPDLPVEPLLWLWLSVAVARLASRHSYEQGRLWYVSTRHISLPTRVSLPILVP
jgi:hypothetical protein